MIICMCPVCIRVLVLVRVYTRGTCVEIWGHFPLKAPFFYMNIKHPSGTINQFFF